MDENLNAAVLGAGSWGTALAKLLADNGHRVRLWCRRTEQAEAIEAARENEAYLPGFRLPDDLHATSDLEGALDGVGLILSVVPTHGLRAVLEQAKDLFPADAPVLSCTKGIEQESLLMVSGVFEAHLPADRHHLLTYLAGPSFAREVAARMPTAVTVAGHDEKVAHRVQHHLRNPSMRVYTTDDVVGAELGGALKNVIAIAAGVGDGLGFGHNARAAIITRGLAEIGRLGAKMGAHPMTVHGLAGMGDLVLTCTGDLSRNRKVGLALGAGQKLADILAGMNMVAEGVKTTKSAHELALREGVEMPITAAMYKILYEDQDPKLMVTELMTRAARKERDDHHE
ncbi:MAG: NAD(P)-dependent glycerol-3-phosphate dehydrogenase [Sandaracinaceae bacterium]|nr:NAD(P)-dependent glycerol-3-phosphate dehydrogenase [Sandaracinaceae bacterium]